MSEERAEAAPEKRRKVSYPYRFEAASGTVLILHHPNSSDLIAVESTFEESRPPAPTKVVETAFGEEEVRDYSEDSNLEYAITLNRWYLDRSMQLTDFQLLEYVEVEGGLPKDLSSIERSYERMKRRYNADPPYDLADPEDCHIAFVRKALSKEEMRQVLEILGGFEPTEEEVASAEATFPGEVRGEAADAGDS